MTLPDHNHNGWLLANEFMRVFRHLEPEPGWQLACVFTPWAEERESHLVLVRFDQSTLPEIPHTLARWRPTISFTGAAPSFADGSLPDWIEWTVTRRIRHHNTALALFEFSLFARWVDQLLNFGHNVFWGRHSVLSGDERCKELLAQCGAQLSASELQPTVSFFA